MHSSAQNDKTSRVYEALASILGQQNIGDWSSDHNVEAQTFRGWNYVAITACARQAARSHAYVWDDAETQLKDRRKGLETKYGRRWMKAFSQEAAAAALDPEHPVSHLVDVPNPHQSGGLFRWEFIQQMRLHGSCIIFNRPNMLGTYTVERYIIPLALTQPVYPGEREECPSGGIMIQASKAGLGIMGGYFLSQLAGYVLPREALSTIHYPHTYLRGDGQSPSDAASLWIDSSRMVDVTRFRQLRRGPKPTGIVTADGDIDDAYCEDLQDRLNRMLRDIGEDDDQRVIVVRKGTSFDKDLSPDEMGYSNSFTQLADAILAAQGVSKASVGLQDGMTYSSLAASMQASNSISIQPDLDLLADADSRFYSKEHGREISVEYEAQAFDDPTLTESQLATDLDAGNRTGREWRSIRGLPPYGDWRDDARVTKQGFVFDPPRPPPAEPEPAAGAPPSGERGHGPDSSGIPEQAQRGLTATSRSLYGQVQRSLMRAPVVAVDFDSTISDSDADYIDELDLGLPNLKAIAAVQALAAAGCGIVIFTGRDDTTELRDWLEVNGVPFDGINESLGEQTGSGNPFADALWDDLNIAGEDAQGDLVAAIAELLPEGEVKARLTGGIAAGDEDEELGIAGVGVVMLEIPARLSAVLAQERKELAENCAVIDEEVRPHVTLLMGIRNAKTQQIVDAVRKLTACQLSIGNIGCFANEDEDVVRYEVASGDLLEMRDQLRDKFTCEVEEHDFNPHITLLYAEPGQWVVDVPGVLTGKLAHITHAIVQNGMEAVRVPLADASAPESLGAGERQKPLEEFAERRAEELASRVAAKVMQQNWRSMAEKIADDQALPRRLIPHFTSQEQFMDWHRENSP